MSLTGDVVPQYTLEGKVNTVIPNQIDTTLTVEGAAADAKATGAAIDAAKKEAADNQKAHEENYTNPHKVTKTQIGLEKVDNTSDLEKPVSTAQAAAIADAKKAGTDAKTAAQNAQTAAEEAKTYADGLHKVFEASLTAEGWAGDAAPYTQEVGIDGVLETDTPHVFPVYTDALSNFIRQKFAWARVDDSRVEDGKITFICYSEKPAMDLDVQIEVNR